MKLQFMATCAIFYVFSIQSGQSTSPQTIQITIDASTKSDLPQHNSLQQAAKHASQQEIDIATLIKNRIYEKKQTPELTPVNSISSAMIKKGVAGYAITAMASAANPWILPAFVAWRIACACVSDDPWMDRATEQEAQELAAKGKKRVDEPVIFPVIYYLTRSSGK
jgi:hypothetical protein